jgi:hypothetical protein
LTFETEEEQRKVLNELSVGYWQAHLNNRKTVAKAEFLFREEHVLYVSEPDEPSTIRWEDLNVSFFQWLKLIVASHIITLIGTVMAFFVVRYGKIGLWTVIRVATEISSTDFIAFYSADSHFRSVKVVSYTISVLNSLFPRLAHVLTELEQHTSAGYVRTSLFLKVALFRWLHTAVVTPFTATQADDEHDGIIYKVYCVFLSEIVTTAILQLAWQIFQVISTDTFLRLEPNLKMLKSEGNANPCGSSYIMPDIAKPPIVFVIESGWSKATGLANGKSEEKNNKKAFWWFIHGTRFELHVIWRTSSVDSFEDNSIRCDRYATSISQSWWSSVTHFMLNTTVDSERSVKQRKYLFGNTYRMRI